MNNQRINCKNCGKPLVNGIYYSVAGIQCKCGYYTDLAKMRENAEAEDVACVFKGRTKKRTPYKREKSVMMVESVFSSAIRASGIQPMEIQQRRRKKTPS